MSLHNTSRALLVGIDAYEMGHVTPLLGAANDARALNTALVNHLGFPRDGVRVLVNDEARIGEFGIALQNAVEEVGSEGLLLLFFAGHGVRPGGTRNDHLVFYESDIRADVNIRRTCFPIADIEEELQKTSAQRILVLLDCCRKIPLSDRSGQTAEMPEDFGGRDISLRPRPDGVAHQADVGQEVATIFACGPNLSAYESEKRQRGYFSLGLEDAFSGRASEDGVLTLSGLETYLSSRIGELVRQERGSGAKQVPWFRRETAGDWVLGRFAAVASPQFEVLPSAPEEGPVIEEQPEVAVTYGWVKIDVGPESAVLSIDGERVSAGIMRLSAGSHTVQAQMHLYHSQEEPFTVAPGQTTEMQLHLSPAFGKLSIQSDPTGARVILNGVDTGQVTPYENPTCASGKMQVLLRLDEFYDDWSENVNIHDGETTEVNAPLSPNFGTLSIAVDPPGVSVVVNDESWGESPVERRVKAGSYEVVVEGEKYLKMSQTLRVNRGQSETVSWALQPKTGAISVSSDPPGAAIFLDGEERPEVTPAVLTGVVIGSHQLRLVHGANVKEILVTVEVGELVEIEEDLKFIKENAHLATLEKNPFLLDWALSQHSWEVTPDMLRQLFSELKKADLLPIHVGELRRLLDERRVLIDSQGGPSVEEMLLGGAKMAFVYIPPGRFTMGSPESEEGRNVNEGPLHQVTISQGFYLGKYVVTQAQWKAVMKTTPWESWRGVRVGSDCPAACVSWEDIQTFIQKLNAAAEDEMFRLPTEAEWEYACRAGTSTRWSFGDNEGKLEEYAWYNWNQGGAAEVGTKRPNPWGLYDMHGKVWELCQNWYGTYSSRAQVDPTGPVTGSDRVIRGGTFTHDAQVVRSASRSYYLPDIRHGGIGFRLLRRVQ